MAKDDYEVVAFQILLYFYAIMKGKRVYTDLEFQKVIRADISDEYLARILHMMEDEGLITGISLIKIWGGNYIIASDLSDAEITAAGIRYLKEHHEIRDMLLKKAGYVASLIVEVALAYIQNQV